MTAAEVLALCDAWQVEQDALRERAEKAERRVAWLEKEVKRLQWVADASVMAANAAIRDDVLRLAKEFSAAVEAADRKFVLGMDVAYQAYWRRTERKEGQAEEAAEAIAAHRMEAQR
jgi:hypothetical protein